MSTSLPTVTPSAPVSPSTEREGLNITLGALEPGAAVAVSDVWSVAGWTIQFARLGAGQTLGLDQSQGRIYIKVVTGELASLRRGPFAAPREIRDTLVEAGEVSASDHGALVTVFTETAVVDANITSMDQLQITGPQDDAFRWRSFDERFGQFTDIFRDAEAYMSSGFHLLDGDGTEISYVNLWTAGKGVDLSTHNHAGEPSPLSPAFAEVHWVFNNGTGSGGMYGAEQPGSAKDPRYPMQRGQEHGTFFVIDPVTKSAKLRENGAVEYPWHGWEAGSDDKPGQAFDFVAAFETNPDYVTL